ncbi:hypothetical protein Taro_035901 [Colocasia esculenta]|uniref:Uncharacterized protein n=1 Tax=Colocasia esculenta TaxID=4460 RepID=A0A843W562_COLES|nr:hypothetical protein [Colocasia esculenta]
MDIKIHFHRSFVESVIEKIDQSTRSLAESETKSFVESVTKEPDQLTRSLAESETRSFPESVTKKPSQSARSLTESETRYDQHLIYSSQPEISIALTSGFFTSSLGTVTVSTPFSMEAFTWSTWAFSGSRNRLTKLPPLRSIRCQVSVFSSFSLRLWPLIWRIRPSSTSTFTSSLLTPGRSALNTWASGVSFQSTRALAKAEVSEFQPRKGVRGREATLKGKLWKGSHTSREKEGSQTLLLCYTLLR